MVIAASGLASAVAPVYGALLSVWGRRRVWERETGRTSVAVCAVMPLGRSVRTMKKLMRKIVSDFAMRER